MECEIKIEQLQSIVNKLFDHIVKTRGVSSIKITADHNYYWEFDPEQLYKVSVDPTKFTVGSLNDDLEFVASLLEKDAIPVAYQLTEVAPLLRYIGETLGKDLAKYGG